MPIILTDANGRPLVASETFDAAGNAITSHSSALDVSIRSQAADLTVAQATAASLNATVVQGTATNLKTQAEAYQGGSAVASGNPLQVTLANTGANATAVKVDGSAATQPISGTVTVQQGTASSLKAQVTGGGAAGTADAGVLTVQGIASMTPVQVSQATAASLNATVVGTGTFAVQNTQSGTASQNVAQLAGTATSVNSGTKDNGTLRVVLATDQPTLTNAQPVTSGAGATTIGKAEDAASADGDVGVPAMAIRQATPANTSGTDGDYEMLRVSNGRLWTQGTNIRIYGGSNTLTTTNFVSLANGSGWQSAGLTTNGNDLQFVLTTKGTGTAYVDFYVAEELSNGSTWTDGATGSEGTFTAANRLNSRYLGSLRLNNASATAAFKLSDIYGVMPAKVALIGINNSGAAISATGGDTVFTYETAV